MRTLGWFGSDIWDEVEDVATSIVDKVSDAGGSIASVLKAVAPFVGLVPGIGTAFAVAMSAAAAIAVGDPIDRAAIDIASAAIPGGAPRQIFSASAELTRSALRGEPMAPVVLSTMRQTAVAFGGDRAGEAFDAGVDYARTGRLDDASLQALRSQIGQGGPAALAAFDASYGVATKGNVDDVAIQIARDYIAQTGGPSALAIFDGAVALAQGQELQDAGFAALKNFVKGSDLAERSLRFVKLMAQSARSGIPLGQILVDTLNQEMRSAVGAAGGLNLGALLGPVIDRIKADPSLMQAGSDALALAMHVAEPIARAAQAIMRSGEEDAPLREKLTALPGYSTTVRRAFDPVHVGPADIKSTIANTNTGSRLFVGTPPPTTVARAQASVPIPAIVVPSTRAAAIVKSTATVEATAPETSSAALDVATGGGVALVLLGGLWLLSRA
jgi:hypothetical protein